MGRFWAFRRPFASIGGLASRLLGGPAPAVTTDTDLGLPARRAALDILSASLARRAGLDEALNRPAFGALPPRDRGFAMALAMATLRRLGAVDRALDAKLAKAPPDAVRNIMRIGVIQAFVLDTPAFAAVTTSVDLEIGRAHV